MTKPKHQAPQQPVAGERTVMFSARLPESLVARLAAWAAARELTRTEAARRMLDWALREREGR